MNIILRTGVVFFSLLSLSACTKIGFDKRESGEIPFKLIGVETGACPLQTRIGQDKWQLDYFGFYLSNPEVRIDGRWQVVKFKQNEWQTKNVAFLTFHSLCNHPENANSKIILDVSDEFMKLATNLRFTLGLPFEQNHQSPESLATPLNNKAMFTSVQQGHKFMRLDLSHAASDKQWRYSLGSVGCHSASADEAPEKVCDFTNRVEFILPMTQLDTDLALEISISNIVSQVNLDLPQDCAVQSPESSPCNKLLNNLLHRPWLKWD
jgi:uncharacterized repeat protein (TIGR04052 family)